jgi:hypothetical protein
MASKVSAQERATVISMMLQKDDKGEPIYGQRDLEKITKLSRPFIRKLANQVGHQFPRNGIEIKGTVCMCVNCGNLFRRPKSKIIRAKNNFCDDVCREAFMKGENHPSWKTGKSANTFSSWVKNQSEYKQWRLDALARAEYKCEVTGRTELLDVHHICPKQEKLHPERVFDPDNALVLCKEAHIRIHEIIKSGKDFQEAVEILKEEYSNKGENV